MTHVYPGVWRLTFGKPEEDTPVRYAFRPPLEEALNALEDLPLPDIAEALDFTVTKRGCRIIAPMDREERIYGGGISTRVFDKTDRRIIVRPTDRPETEEGGSHGPCPFFVSTRGYGFYLDTARYAQMYFGVTNPLGAHDRPEEQKEIVASSAEELYARKAASHKTMLWEIPTAKGIDVYIFAGRDISDVVSRYNLFCGGGALPPLWGLGIHYRGDSAFTAEEHIQLAKSFREEGIPCDMWGLEPKWQDQTYSCSYKWNLTNFPDPAAFGREMSRLGLHVSAWQHCFTHPTSPIYEEICPYSGDFKVWQGAVPDFTLPGAREIFQRQQNESLFSMEGFDCVKLDECDHQPEGDAFWSFPESAVFPGGLDGEQMHSLIGPLYQQTMAEPLGKQNRRTWGLVRETHAMAAPLPYSVYSDSYTQDCYLRGMANTGFCGQMWVPELREASSIEDLYRRIQICLLGSIMVVNCWYLKMPPWKQITTGPNREYVKMPGHEEVTGVVRELFKLRMSLIPYLYTAFNEYARKGLAPVRALVSDYSDDPATYAVDTQFLLGDRLMVCPCLTGKSAREVYFPRGTWVDFYTGDRIEGGASREITTPIERLAIYVKDDCILPVADPLPCVGRDSVFRLTVRRYGTGELPFTLYEDDGESCDWQRGAQNTIILRKDSETRQGGYTGAPRYEIGARKDI